MQATSYHHTIKQSAKQAFKSKVWRGITLRWNKLILPSCGVSQGLPVGPSKAKYANVSGPPLEAGDLDCCSTYLHIQYKKAQAFKVTAPSPCKSGGVFFFLHSGPLSTMLVTGGNCLFFPYSTLETLDSLFEGVYEILEVEFMSAMLWDLWYDIDSLIGTWERFGEFSKFSTIQLERLNRIIACSGLS